MTDQVARRENAAHEIAGHEIVTYILLWLLLLINIGLYYLSTKVHLKHKIKITYHKTTRRKRIQR